MSTMNTKMMDVAGKSGMRGVGAGAAGEVRAAGKTLVVFWDQDRVAAGLAEQAAERMGADSCALTAVAPYPETEALRYARLQWETNTGMWPALAELPDVAAYDTVLVGSSAYNGMLAPAVARFLLASDLSDKAVGLFTPASKAAAEHMTEQLSELSSAMLNVETLTLSACGARVRAFAAWCDEIVRRQQGVWGDLRAYALQCAR